MGRLTVIWSAGGGLFGTDAALVAEVLAPLPCVSVADAPEWMRGSFVYRASTVLLVDAAKLWGRKTPQDRMINRVLVVRRDGADGGGLLGLWVESVVDLERLEWDATDTSQEQAAHAGMWPGPVVSTRRGPVRIVHPSALLTREQDVLVACVLGFLTERPELRQLVSDLAGEART